MKHPLTVQIEKELNEALQKFGTYSFDDKGPEEVMNLANLKSAFRKLSLTEKIQVAQDLKSSDRGSMVLVDLIYSAHLNDNDLNQLAAVANPVVGDFLF